MSTRACRACLIHPFAPHPRWIMAPVTAAWLSASRGYVSSRTSPVSRTADSGTIVRSVSVSARAMRSCFLSHSIRARRCLSRLALLAPTPRGSPCHSLALASEHWSCQGSDSVAKIGAAPNPYAPSTASSSAPWRRGPTGMGWDVRCRARLRVFFRSLTTGPPRLADGDGCAVSSMV